MIENKPTPCSSCCYAKLKIMKHWPMWKCERLSGICQMDIRLPQGNLGCDFHQARTAPLFRVGDVVHRVIRSADSGDNYIVSAIVKDVRRTEYGYEIKTSYAGSFRPDALYTLDYDEARRLCFGEG